MNKRIKLVMVLSTLLAAFALLFVQGFKAGGGPGKYLTIQEALSGYDQDKRNFVQIEGRIESSSVNYDPKQPLLTFQITDGTNKINVVFKDIKPDNFDSGYPVIVEGRFSEEKRLVAERLLVKCPSKYEEEVKTK